MPYEASGIAIGAQKTWEGPCAAPSAVRAPTGRGADRTPLHTFLVAHHGELVARCKEEVERLVGHGPAAREMTVAIRQLLNQLTKTCRAEAQGMVLECLRISSAARDDDASPSEVGLSASIHGRHLLELGCTAKDVARAYALLGRVVTDVAVERGAHLSTAEFRTFMNGIANAVAHAVSPFTVLARGHSPA